MAKIRHEINLLNGLISPAAGATGSSNEFATLTLSAYSGTVTYYFEAVVQGGGTGPWTGSLRLRTAFGIDDATIAMSALTSSYQLLRSAAFSPSASPREYRVFSDSTGASNWPNIKAARIVILQDTGSDTLDFCETSIEIGSRSSVTATSIPTGATASNQTSPKYWKYDSSKWDGNVTFFFEAVLTSPSTKSAATVQLQVADGSGDGFTGWANVTNGSVTTTSTSAALVRTTTALTPVNGRWYRIVSSSPTSKTAMNVYAAKVIVSQTVYTDLENYRGIGNQSTSGGNLHLYHTQSFTGSANQVDAIQMWMCRTASPPGGSFRYLLWAHFGTYGTDSQPTGSPLAATDYTSASALTPQASAPVLLKLTSPYTTAAATNYVVGVDYASVTGGSGSVYVSSFGALGDGHSGNEAHITMSFIIGWFAGLDLGFVLKQRTVSAGITKLQPQYLLANTLFSAGTALQLFLTNWDSTEWSSVTNTYKLEVNAANGSTSDVQLRTSNDATLVATVTDPDNAGSGTATMP